MSTIRAATVANLAGTGPVTLTGQKAQTACLSYNQAVPSIQSSFNISSVTDNGAGVYDPNFTNAHVNAAYPLSGCTGMVGNTRMLVCMPLVDPRTTTGLTLQSGWSNVNYDMMSTSNFTGDLA